MKTTITIRIDQDIKDRLQSLSDAKICHVSDLIREGIKSLLHKDKLL